jgi:hypothetical protein
MRVETKPIALLVAAIGLAGCGGGKGGLDGSTPPGACAALSECECVAASEQCVAHAQVCWCPRACDPSISCVCDGGQFLACDNGVDGLRCGDALAAVQTKCAGNGLLGYIGGVCANSLHYGCVAGCLERLATSASCSEIDCTFCPNCGDCTGFPTVRSPFADCIIACM